jgi:cell division protein FtsB
MKRLPHFLRNFYVITSLAFFLWMLILDPNDLITRFRLSARLRALEREKIFYQEKIQEVEKQRQELFGDQESLEKFAREQYLMKKDGEDLFVIVEEK